MSTKPKQHQWSNPEVENVVIWLENDRVHYQAIQSRRRVWYDGDGDNTIFTQGDRLRAFATAIRNYCTGLWPRLVTPDGFDLHEVDWLEVASHWVEQ